MWIDRNDDGDFGDTDEIQNMTAADANDCADGRVYTFTTTIDNAGDGDLDYRFYATDGIDVATEDHYPVTGSENQVTVLATANTPPILSWATGQNCLSEGVRPVLGASGEDFEFYVKYTDADGTCPPTASDIQVWIDEDGDGYDLSEKHDLTEFDGGDADCSDGKLYKATLSLSNLGDTNYRFYGSDGTDTATGTPVIGSDVTVIDAIVVRPSGQGGDYNSVGAGIGGSSANDTILVYPNSDFTAATYSENITMANGTDDRTIQSTCGADLTTISSSSGGNVFYFNNGAYNNVFDGFTITGATAGSGFNGNYNSSFAVKNSKIHGNGFHGIYLKTTSSADVENCEIYDNSLTGLWTDSSGCSVNISGSDIYQNGRGVNFKFSSHTITDSIIRDNTGTGSGIGLTSNGATVTVSNTTFKDNESTLNRGGGIYFYNSGSGTFNQCSFTGNKAINSDSGANVTGGGAVFIDVAGAMNFTNTIFAGNQGTDGGAFYYKNSSSTTLTNVTFAENEAITNGGAIWGENSITTRNSIFWNNSAGNEGHTAYKSAGPGDILSVSFSNISTHAGEIDGSDVTVSGSDNIDPAEDPFFVSSGDYHLTSISPCIDQASATFAPDTDIDGDSRPQGSGDDMGADEYNSAPSLDWTGETNYTDDGINPDSAPGASTFEFRVDYFDAGNDAPTTIQIWVDENDNGSYEANEKYDLTETDGGDSDYSDGKRYSTSLTVGYYGDGSIRYRFYATDGSAAASGEPVYDKMLTLTSNNAPTLEWTGETGYTSDGVDPDSAPASSSFTFRVTYIDVDDKPPVSIQVWVDRDDDTSYEDGQNPAEKIDLVEVDSNDSDYSDGKLYTVSVNLAYGNDNSINYRFFANDGFDNATGSPIADNTVEVTASANTVPTLEWANTTGYTADGVEPNSGAGLDPGLSVGTTFVFRVKYSDDDDEAPSVIQVWIDKDDDGQYEDGVTPDETITLSLDPDAGNDGDYTNGEIYTTSQTIPLNDGSVTYRFYAKDAIAEVTSGDPVTGGSISLVDPLVVCASGCEYTLIQDAIDDSSNGDVIIVRDGTYQENINYRGSMDFVARDVTVQSENGAATTSITGTPAGNASVVSFQENGNTANSVLDGFTINNQYEGGSASRGIRAEYGATPTIKNCVVKGNVVADGTSGAGIYINGGSASISNSTIGGDAANKNTCEMGCGIYAASLTGELQIIDSEISYNDNTAGGGAAGIYLYSNGATQTTITNTTISNNSANSHGGAMWVQDATFSITDSTFSDNSVNVASRHGGAIYVSNSDGNNVTKMEIKDTDFDHNSTTQSGGAVYLYSPGSTPKLIIDGGTFDSNSSSGGQGGAVYFNNAVNAPTIDNATFINNSATTDGGAIYVLGTEVAITDSLIGAIGTGNTAAGAGGGLYANTASAQVTISGGAINGNSAQYGGGLLNNSGTVSVTGTSINGNTATSTKAGGVYLTGSGTLSLTKTYVQGNLAEQRGGGMHIEGGSTATLTNCIVSGNTVDSVNGIEGGGIHNTGQLNIYSSTVAGNSAPNGGGLYIFGQTGGNLDMSNSIFWDNVASTNPEIVVTYFNAGFSMIFSDIEGGFVGGETNHDNIDLDPLFVLSDPASPIGTPKTTGDYRIQSGSAAIDVGGGTTDLDPAPPTDDIQGDSRPADISGQGDGFEDYDMGADEYALDPNSTVAGTATAVATNDTSIYFEMPYSGDADGGNTYTVRYRVSPAGGWQDFVVNHAHVASPYTDTITGLTSNETYDVEMTYNDGDTVSGTNPQTETVVLKPTVSFTSGSQSTANESGTATITAQLSTVSSLDVSVPFTINGSSTATGSGTDYTITVTPITITAGNTTADITVTIATDGLDENDETVIVDMGTPTNATASGTTSHQVTITDDDDMPTVSFTSGSQATVNESGIATITAQLSAVSGRDVTVPFTVNGTSTAMNPDDYTITATPITIIAGNLTEDITVTIATDSDVEGDETVIVDMDSPTNASQGATTTHTLTITDDDSASGTSYTVCNVSHADDPCDFQSISAGIADGAVVDGDTLLVSADTYSENINYGGKNITILSASGAASTILEGDGSNAPVVTFSSAETASAVLDGFTIDNQATANTTTRGISITASAAPVLKNLVVKGNLVTNTWVVGAGIYINGGSAAIETSTIGDATLPNNAAKGSGIYAEALSAPLSITGTTITENTGGGNGQGVGIYLKSNGSQMTTITDSTLSNNVAAQYGAAIYLNAAKVSINSSTINNNSVTASGMNGGAIYANDAASSITLTNTNFTGNTVTSSGGAIYIAASTEATPLSIAGGTFTGSGGIDAGSLGGAICLGNMINQSIIDGVTFTGLQAQKGGAIYTQGALKIQNNSLIYSNSSTLDGGGLRADGANAALVIDNSSVYSNTGSIGGGILVENSGSLTVQNNSDIYSNEATSTLGGGIYNTTSGTVTVTNSTIRGNKSKQHGGGIYNAATGTLTNTIVSGNAAGTSTWENGGGIHNAGTITLMNCTVAGNHGPNGGGLNTTGTATVTNSLFWDNSGNSGKEEINGTATVTYSDVEGGYTGTGNINLDPNFVTPAQASAGSATSAGDFHIQAGSPVVDQGTTTDAPDDDIDGEMRPLGGGIDMGADEKE